MNKQYFKGGDFLILNNGNILRFGRKNIAAKELNQLLNRNKSPSIQVVKRLMASRNKDGIIDASVSQNRKERKKAGTVYKTSVPIHVRRLSRVALTLKDRIWDAMP